MSNIKISSIQHNSHVDGPGCRSVVFTQGCYHECPGCQSAHTHDFYKGRYMNIDDLADELIRHGDQITISGGEPFVQGMSLLELVGKIRLRLESAHIIIYTGYHFDDLTHPINRNTLSKINVLVDGRYTYQLDSADMQYRGSSNQRVIDTQTTLKTGVITMLDWDQPELIIGKTGQIIATGPLADMIAGWGMGQAESTRRCGQSHKVT